MIYEKLNIEIIIYENYFDKIEELEDCVKIYNDDTLKFIIYKNSKVFIYNSTRIYTYNDSTVDAFYYSTVYAYENSKVHAKDYVTVNAYDSSKIYAYHSSKVDAYHSSKVYAYDSSKVYAYDNSKVDAYNFSYVYVRSHKVKIKTENHFGAIIKQVFKIKKDMIVYKKLQDDKIATLKLVKGQTFQSERFIKCRTDRAFVIAIESIDKKESFTSGVSLYDENFIYAVRKEVIADRYDKNIDECSNGIHFFLTREKAEEYEL